MTSDAKKEMFCPTCQMRTVFTDTSIFGWECSICKGQAFVDDDSISQKVGEEYTRRLNELRDKKKKGD